jgi:phosphoglycolate phosphatase
MSSTTNSFNPAEVRLVVFDWDGTLMDSEYAIVQSMQRGIADLGLAPRTDDQVRNIIGLGLREAVSALYPAGEADLPERLAEAYRTHWFQFSQDQHDLFPGVLDLLEWLNAHGYFIAIATGKSRRGLNRVLADTGLEPLIHASRCADETRSKPHPQMLEEILDLLGLSPKQAVMVGDTEYDMELARNAGVLPIAVCYGTHEPERLHRHAPLACLESLHGVRELLTQ